MSTSPSRALDARFSESARTWKRTRDTDLGDLETESQALEKLREDGPPDVGSQTQYCWGGQDGVVYHTETEGEIVDPFFNSVDEDEHYLESLADITGKAQYTGLGYRIPHRTIRTNRLVKSLSDFSFV